MPSARRCGSSWPAGLTLAATAALATVLLLSGGGPATGAPRETPTPAGASNLALEMRGLTGTLLPGDDLEVRVRARNPGRATAEGLRVEATLHGRASSRSQFQAAVDDQQVGAALHGVSRDVGELGARRARTVTVEASASELGLTPAAGRHGVYPLRLRLLAGDEVVDEIITAVVLTPDDVTHPLLASLLVPLDAPPALSGEGAYRDGALLDDLAPGGRLRRLVDEAGTDGRAPLTLASSGLLLDQVNDLAAGFELVDDDGRTAVAADQRMAQHAEDFLALVSELAADDAVEQLALPYGPGDLVSLARGGLSDEVHAQLETGRAAVTAATGAAVSESVLWPPDGLTSRALAAAQQAGASSAVLSESFLGTGTGRSLTPTPHRRLPVDRGEDLTLLVPDPWLERALAGSEEDALLVRQRVLAETATVFFERPFSEQARGLLLAPPQLWEPPAGLLAELATGIDEAPWLDGVTLADLAAAVPVDEEPAALSYPAQARLRELPAGYVAAIAQARDDLESFKQVLESDNVVPDRFDMLLRAAGSVHFRDAPRAGHELIDTVRDIAAELFSSVEVVQSPQVVLSSLEGQLPVAVRNGASVPVQARVRLETQRYEFPNGSVSEAFVVEPGATATLTFSARALAPGGVHQIRVVVEDAEGRHDLAVGTLVVRSTAVSITALVITAAAGGFLLAWWLREAARRRRQRRVAQPVDV